MYIYGTKCGCQVHAGGMSHICGYVSQVQVIIFFRAPKKQFLHPPIVGNLDMANQIKILETVVEH